MTNIRIPAVSEDVLNKAKKIKLLLTDVDGVLTDASMNFFSTPEGKTVEVKKFNAYDGISCHMLRDCGIKTGIITGGNAPATEFRAETLGMDFLYFNFLSKLPPLQDIIKKTGIPYEEVAFIGDDFIDIPALRKVGLACAVKTGRPEVVAIADYVTVTPGGHGVFREITELILKAQGKWDIVLKSAEEGTIGHSPKCETVFENFKTWKV